MQILAIDVGNTRIKWGYYANANRLNRGNVANADFAQLDATWSSLAQPQKIIISNVADEHIAENVRQLLARWQSKPQWIEARDYQCGLRNSYTIPQQLGCDRWAALIAAWQLDRQASIVINLGTAITIDSLSADGVFIGGVIVPGLHLMVQALAGKTVKLATQPGAFSAFPVNTADGIRSGTLHAVCGAIERLVRIAARENEGKINCILSGGDAELIAPYLNVAHKIVEDLILQGLVKIAETED